MSEYLGIITWNVKGDLATSSSAGERVDDLSRVLDELASKPGWPVHFICLQETSGNDGALKDHLEAEGYTCHTLREGNGQGDSYVFAAAPNSGFTFDAAPVQCLFQYQSLSGSPLRYPASAQLTRASDGLKAAVYTYHASLDGGLVEGLEKCSAFAENTAKSGQVDYVLVAGDLNITSESTIFISRLGRYVKFMGQIFPQFAGVSHHLDHVMCYPDVGLRNIRGVSYHTTSDHELLYARIEIG